MNDILDTPAQVGRNFENYAAASKGKRLASYLIDVTAYYVVCLIIGLLLGVVFPLLGLEAELLRWADSQNPLSDWLYGIVIMMAYYVLSEYVFDGKTVGKFFTRTRAVSLDSSKMNLSTVATRSVARVVPFEPFSFLGDGNGWHDKWSETRVIDERKFQ